jgi:hypothetical protein
MPDPNKAPKLSERLRALREQGVDARAAIKAAAAAKPKYANRPRDRAYMSWIATLPCAVCGVQPVDVAHVGDRAFGQKCPDRQTIPLCRAHHLEGPAAAHVLGKKFWQHHGLNRDEHLASLERAYRVKIAV